MRKAVRVRVHPFLVRCAVLGTLALALAAPGPAHALVAPMGVAELTRAADTIVVARVADVRTRSADEPGLPEIVTDTRFVVSRTLKGGRPTVFTLTQPGGVLGDLALVVSDTPTFFRGQECVLFLRGGVVVGGPQGALDVENGHIRALGTTVDGFARTLSAEGGLSLRDRAAFALSSLPNTLGRSFGEVSVQAVPTITSVTPPNANAGIGETVTIVGTGFGPTQGAGRVEFSAGDSLLADAAVTAPVVSWSDTRIVVAVPRLAEAWVRVVGASGTSAKFAYDCGFSTDGRRWGSSSLPVTYRINENTADMVGEGAEIRAAFDVWNQAGSRFRLAYGGSTSAADRPPKYDGVNTVCFSHDSDGGYLARNYYWMTLTSPPTIIESDIVFNDMFTWGGAASGTVFDVQTVALHELGHTLGLDDQYEEYSDVMGACRQGVSKRVLSDDERAGAIYLYGQDAVLPQAPVIASSTHPDQDAWYAAPGATFSFTSPGAVGYSYVLDTAPSTVPDTASEGAAASASYPSVPEGTSYFHVRAQGGGGAWGEASHYRVRVDVTPPVTTSDTLVSYRSSASVTLTSRDDLSGVTATYWRLDGAPEVPWTGKPIVVTSPGTHTLGWYSVDAAGNTEDLTSATFTVEVQAPASVVRLAGRDRWETAVAIASDTFPGWAGVKDVVVACGEDRAMADPLAAAGLAGCYDAPIVIVPSTLRANVLPPSIERAIKGMRDANGGRVNVHVIGGTAVVPAAVYRRLDALNGSGTIRRIAGPDRYATSARVAQAVAAAVGPDNVPAVLVANGADNRAFSDALAVAPASAAGHRPLLLVRPTGVPQEVAATLAGTFRNTPRIVVNSAARVPESVRTSVGATTRMTTSADRVTAAVQIADFAVAEGWLVPDRVCVTNTLPDALSGGSAMGYRRAPIVYTDAATLPAATRSFLVRHASRADTAYALGGPVVISERVLDSVRSALE